MLFDTQDARTVFVCLTCSEKIGNIAFLFFHVIVDFDFVIETSSQTF